MMRRGSRQSHRVAFHPRSFPAPTRRCTVVNKENVILATQEVEEQYAASQKRSFDGRSHLSERTNHAAQASSIQDLAIVSRNVVPASQEITANKFLKRQTLIPRTITRKERQNKEEESNEARGKIEGKTKARVRSTGKTLFRAISIRGGDFRRKKETSNDKDRADNRRNDERQIEKEGKGKTRIDPARGQVVPRQSSDELFDKSNGDATDISEDAEKSLAKRVCAMRELNPSGEALPGQEEGFLLPREEEQRDSKHTKLEETEFTLSPECERVLADAPSAIIDQESDTVANQDQDPEKISAQEICAELPPEVANRPRRDVSERGGGDIETQPDMLPTEAFAESKSLNSCLSEELLMVTPQERGTRNRHGDIDGAEADALPTLKDAVFEPQLSEDLSFVTAENREVDCEVAFAERTAKRKKRRRAATSKEAKRRRKAIRAQSAKPSTVSKGLHLPIQPANLAIWRYDKSERRRVYISLQGRKLYGKEAFLQSKLDKQTLLLSGGAEGTTSEQKNASAPSQSSSLGSSISQLSLPASLSMEASNPERLQLIYWGIPETISNQYREELGIVTLFPWQAECLEKDNGSALMGGNLVYSAPTSGGKTLIAEILMIRMITLLGKKILFVLPYISVVAEKTSYFSRVLEPLDIVVKAFSGPERSGGSLTLDGVDIAVCTFEKANGLINKAVSEGTQSQLGMIVADEIHMIGEKSRGYMLELAISKLLYATKDSSLQIVCMSATLANIESIATWLNATSYTSLIRPVPLKEHIVLNGEVFSDQLAKLRLLPRNVSTDPDGIVTLCTEVMEAHGTLIFCPSKKWCDDCAKLIAAAIELPQEDQTKKRNEVIEDLRATPAGLCSLLEKTIPKGIAYHHSGLTMEERTIVEEAYREGTLRVLVATTTLATGINLPARRVIIRAPKIAYEDLDATSYIQLCGRAGRQGHDSVGESFLIINASQLPLARNLLKKHTVPVRSCLQEGRVGLKRLFLDMIASGLLNQHTELESFLQYTFLASAAEDPKSINKYLEDALKFLIECSDDDHNSKSYKVTRLGKACFCSAMDIDDAIQVFEDLNRSRQLGLSLETELHLVYLIAPPFTHLEPDWALLAFHMRRLSRPLQSVLPLIGIEERLVEQAVWKRPAFQLKSFLTSVNASVSKKSRDKTIVRHRRFFIALILYDFINESSLGSISEKYGVSRGSIQQLQTTTEVFCHMERIRFGVREELLPLLTVQDLYPVDARSLHLAGIYSVSTLSDLSVEEIFHALRESDRNNLSRRSSGSEQVVELHSKKRPKDTKTVHMQRAISIHHRVHAARK